MNQHGGDLTPGLTPTITPIVNATEKSKETITVVPPPQEYFDMFSHDVAIIQKFTKDYPEMDAEFIAGLNQEIDDTIQSHQRGYDFVCVIHKLPMEKTNMVANYLNIYQEDPDITRLTMKNKRRIKDDAEIIDWVHWIYNCHNIIKHKLF
jgi:hypothetical protein